MAGARYSSPVHRTHRRDRWLAAALAALAGSVDALGFLELGGYFVSFMSGNTTRAGVDLAEGRRAAVVAFGLVVAFVLGVVGGVFAGRLRPGTRRATVLLLVAVLLAAAALLAGAGRPRAAGAVMALAMGAENTIFQRSGEVSVGVTYMTGTLVKLGQRLADALLGGSRTAWVPYLQLWLAFVGGAVAGAWLHRHAGVGGLWCAASFAALLAGVALHRAWRSTDTETR